MGVRSSGRGEYRAFQAGAGGALVTGGDDHRVRAAPLERGHHPTAAADGGIRGSEGGLSARGYETMGSNLELDS